MKSATKFLLIFVLVTLTLFTLSSCIPGDGKATVDHAAGFFWGIWHGWIAPVSLIIGLFNHEIRIYEQMNTGWWYDFGFYMAIISGFGGISLIRRKKKDR